ncbi:phosphoribosylglycinamide formyltransferase [Halomonas denitrificans]|nr:phosphoribosylglycinamide formyltransferase [Halomonas denitrificans]
MMEPRRLVVMLSGRGSNALAIADTIDQGRLPMTLVGAIADRPAEGLDALALRGIDTAEIPRHAFPDRRSFEQALDDALSGYGPDLVAMAGFMRVLSGNFVERHAGQLVNIHPSLLPAYRGLDTHARALADGVAEHGASVHWVTPELDGGPVIAQARVAVEPGDDPDALARRVLVQEHRLYPAVLALLAREAVLSPHGQEANSDEDDLRFRAPLLLDRDLDADGRRIDRNGN